uniref:ATP synthase complex subunit 8 n=1 Tax=Concholepas concholepas TaxID=137544 RepID=H9D1B0_CONCC|nr:ATP synthase F0 subunit 8 [Concholepas concholepas]AFC65047.1 ATP synthase F0 subunit 8 [Concholepas concholepas]WNO19111.1 ATP synthase F0 subunit 8 [Concholepas concholepas]
MPQLSPLNWILLFVLFWSAVLCMSVLLWWSSKIFFQGSSSSSKVLKENKWNW